MGWTVHYTVEVPQGADTGFEGYFASFNTMLHEGCEPIWVEPTAHPTRFDPRPGYDYYKGFTKVQYSESPQVDLRTVVEALQLLAQAHPDWAIRVSDDYQTVSGDVRALDLDAVFADLL